MFRKLSQTIAVGQHKLGVGDLYQFFIRETVQGDAAIIFAMLMLTIQHTMASTHTWGEVIYADAFNFAMTLSGVGLLLLSAEIFVSVDKVKVWARRFEVKEEANIFTA